MTYNAILIDAPWPFDGYTRKGIVPARGEQPYKTMPLHEIAGLPVPELCADNCAVFLWKNASLPRAAAFLADAWRLRLVTDDVFVWVKTDGIGMGYWSRKQTETVALMVKGRPKRRDKGVRQLIEATRREHSRKPDQIYLSIERLVSGPYLEMFATQRYPGWAQHGDQCDKYIAAPYDNHMVAENLRRASLQPLLNLVQP